MCGSSQKTSEVKSVLKAEEDRQALRMQPEKKEEKKGAVAGSDQCCEPACPDACG
jgi:hypothetical protein